MTLPPRPVVAVTIAGALARCTVITNGAAYTTADLVDLARSAGLDPRQTRGAVLLPARALPTLEAAATVRRVIVQRRKSATTTDDLPTFQPAARVGIDTEPTHACARDHCRVPGCRHERTAS